MSMKIVSRSEERSDERGSIPILYPIFSLSKLQIDPNKSNGSTHGQSVDRNENNVRNEGHVALFPHHQRVCVT